MGKNSKKCELLAFAHIEKAAGTSLIHVLRQSFFPGYIDVRPLAVKEPVSQGLWDGVFSSRDLHKISRINPFVRCIGGHSVKPFSDLNEVCPNIRFITILRDPVKRYISQYLYSTERKHESWSFKDYLEIEDLHNFQTRKISKNCDVEEAKRILSERFLLAGIVEEFDEFLVLLRKKIGNRLLNTRYRTRNVRKPSDKGTEITNSQMGQAIDCNKLDIELYEFVRDKILSREKNEYGEDFEKDLGEFRKLNSMHRPPVMGLGMDYLFRKSYLEPVTGIIRIINGLPYAGSY